MVSKHQAGVFWDAAVSLWYAKIIEAGLCNFNLSPPNGLNDLGD